MTFVLQILTHGRRYEEEYELLEEAIAAAIALEREPRERAEHIREDGVIRLDRAAIEALARSRTTEG